MIASSAASIESPARINISEKSAITFFTVETIVLLFLQKWGILMGPAVVEAIFFTVWMGIGALLLAGRLQFNSIRIMLYGAFALFAILAHVFLRHTFSIPSLLQVLALYAPFCLEYKVSKDTYEKCMRFFVGCMLLFVGIELLQDLMQVTIGSRYWINLDKLLPARFTYPGFMYIRPMKFGAKYLMPNAEFFLEPSILAQFIGLALVVEVAYWKRVWVLIALAVGELLTFSGTGLLLLLACSPFLVKKIPHRLAAPIGLLALVGFVALMSTGWASHMLSRAGEFGQNGSSGFYRFNNPLQKLLSIAQHGNIFVGLGAGNLTEFSNQLYWAGVKCAAEYGFVAAICLYVYLIYSLFSGAPNRTIAWALLVTYSFLGGGLGVPMYPMAMLLFGAFLRVEKPEPAPGAAADQAPAISQDPAPASAPATLVRRARAMRRQA